ncbi:hypothetical protein ACOMHN_027950 [Nucella lapillus]
MAATTSLQVITYVILWAWLCSNIAVRADDTCSYATYTYNPFKQRNELTFSHMTCRWGCCSETVDPCCTTPVGLIVGSVIGGCLCLLILISCVCCCCFRQQDTQQTRPGMVLQYPYPHEGGAAVNFSSALASSSMVVESEGAISTSLPPGVYQSPPSYEEVMAGEVNHAFKPDGY